MYATGGARKPQKRVLFVLCLLGVALGQVQNHFRRHDALDPISGAAHAVVLPAAQQLSALHTAWVGWTTTVWKAGGLIQENERLQEQLAERSSAEQRVELLADQVDQLRKLMGLPAEWGSERVLTETVAFFPYEHRLTLAAGSAQGVEAGMPVVTGEGLVGVVQTVEERRSQVLLVSSPALRVGALSTGTGKLAGILRGENHDRLHFEVIDENAPVVVGDWVVTSGYGVRIPRGIRIGQVLQVVRDPTFGSTIAMVRPSVNITQVCHVAVLK